MKSLLFTKKVRDGIEPSSMDLQSTTLPLCYLTAIIKDLIKRIQEVD